MDDLQGDVAASLRQIIDTKINMLSLQFWKKKISVFDVMRQLMHIKRIPKYLKSRGYFIYHQVYRSGILNSAHRMCLCVLYEYQNKRRLLRYEALTDWFW